VAFSREELRVRAVARAGGGLLSALFATTRVRAEGEADYRRLWQKGQPVVFVLWHGRLLAGTYHQRGTVWSR